MHNTRGMTAMTTNLFAFLMITQFFSKEYGKDLDLMSNFQIEHHFPYKLIRAIEAQVCSFMSQFYVKRGTLLHERATE